MLPADFPRRFFSPLTSKHRVSYIYVLLSMEAIFDQAKRIALPKTALNTELRRKFQRENYTFDVSDEEEYDEEPSGDFFQDNIAFTLRLFQRCEWIDVDETGDYSTDLAFITAYGKKLAKFLKEITKTEDQSGHVVNTYSNLQQVRLMPDNGFVCLQNAYDSTENLLTNIEMIYSKIKKYYAAVLANTKPEELLQEHLFGYVQDVVDKLVFPIKVDDSVDRFKGPILSLLLDIESDTGLLEQVIAAAVQTKRVRSADDGMDQVLKMINYIKYNYNDIESYVRQLDEKNQTYIRVTRQKLTYMLSMDTSTKGDIIGILRDAKGHAEDEWLKISGCINLFDVRTVLDGSFYTPRTRRVRRDWEEMPIEESSSVPDELVDSLIDSKVAGYTVAGVNEYIQNLMGERESVSARDVPLENDDDYLMAIFLAMNSTDRRRVYSYDATENMTAMGRYSIPEFVLKKIGE